MSTDNALFANFASANNTQPSNSYFTANNNSTAAPVLTPAEQCAATFQDKSDNGRYGRFNRLRHRNRMLDCSGMSTEDAIRKTREVVAIQLAIQHEIKPLKQYIDSALGSKHFLSQMSYFTNPYEPDDGMFLNFYDFEYRHFIGFKREDSNTYVLADQIHFFVYEPGQEMNFDNLPTIDDIRKFSGQFSWLYQDFNQFYNYAIDEDSRLHDEAHLREMAEMEKEQLKYKFRKD